MTQILALTRQVSPSLDRCELTFLERQSIDFLLAHTQHQAYERALAELGCRVISLPAEPGLPDSVFVEDIAIVLDELAIITRPGAASRRQEIGSIALALQPYRGLKQMSSPDTLEGGDVLRLDQTLYVGISGRTNLSGIRQVSEWVVPYGYIVKPIEVRGCLHLKSAISQIGSDLLLVNPAWVDPKGFGDINWLEVDQNEPYAANALLIGDKLIYPASFPLTRELLEKHDIAITTFDLSELQKAEGAVTCCSLIFKDHLV